MLVALVAAGIAIVVEEAAVAIMVVPISISILDLADSH